MSRLLVGLSVGSGLEGVDVALLRAAGVGLDLAPQVVRTARVAFPPVVRDSLQPAEGRDPSGRPPDLVRNISDTAIHAVRTVAVQAGVSPRDLFAVGLLDPARPPSEHTVPWPEVADRVAEQTGLTTVHGFRCRDRVAGGSGHPITAAADFLLYRSPSEDRLLVHLGAASSVLLLPAGGKLAGAIGFDAAPGNQLLDALSYHGSRGHDRLDPGGKRAVQGSCVEPLLGHWLDHPHLGRRPPKFLQPEAFGRTFLLVAFETARQLGLALPDLLCTATHLVARAIADACRTWLPATGTSRHVFVSGGGVRNGFLWQLVVQKLGGRGVDRIDAIGVSPLARNAAAAGVLAALTCDGVTGNLPHLTGAAAGRVLGHLVPGDGRNWARCAAWMAEQTGDYLWANRAA
jgi:anhydro-N-acetylmuramic acid kinase